MAQRRISRAGSLIYLITLPWIVDSGNYPCPCLDLDFFECILFTLSLITQCIPHLWTMIDILWGSVMTDNNTTCLVNMSLPSVEPVIWFFNPTSLPHTPLSFCFKMLVRNVIYLWKCKLCQYYKCFFGRTTQKCQSWINSHYLAKH